MKVFLSFVLFLFIATEIKAQVASSSLYITLSDLQSVQIAELPGHKKVALSEKKLINGDISILNPSASQIHKFESQAANTQPESKENKKVNPMEIPARLFADSGNSMQMANLNKGAKRGIPLIVYQIDPR